MATTPPDTSIGASLQAVLGALHAAGTSGSKVEAAIPFASPEPDPACEVCRGVGYTLAAETPFSVATLCTCIPTCNACNGGGMVSARGEDGIERAGRCRCQRLPLRVRWWNAARVPGLFTEATFASFDSSRLTAPKLVMAQVAKFLNEWKPRGRGLLLHGEPGRGKTHLVCALIHELTFQRGVPCMYQDWGDLLLDLRSSFTPGAAPTGVKLDTERAIYARLLSTPVLVLDEIGKGRTTDWAQEVAEAVISRRYNAGGTLVGSTNLSPRSPALEAALGDRASSRLYQMTAFLPVMGKDQRKEGAS